MKKLIVLLAMIPLVSTVTFSQSRNEPGNNLGKTLTTMKREFPELRYLRTDAKGDQYEDGYPEGGIALFFYFKNNILIEECMVVQSNDGFPRMWFDTMAEAFNDSPPTTISINRYNTKHWCYSTFQVHLIYVSEHGTNTALLVYEQGGWATGVTSKKFFEKYSPK